jgi:hypothetical protein
MHERLRFAFLSTVVTYHLGKESDRLGLAFSGQAHNDTPKGWFKWFFFNGLK